ERRSAHARQCPGLGVRGRGHVLARPVEVRSAAMGFTTRAATADDAAAIARIYNEGIEDRVGTFETKPRTADDVLGWLDAGYPVVVGEDGDEVVAWASA